MSVIDDSSTRGGKHHYFALPPGARLHEFEVESVLGHGGFGITYLALDTLLQEKVAIKEYLPSDLAVRTADTSVKAKSEGDRGSFESGLASFLEEARLLARLHHPNIMQVRRFFEMHGTGYIVARYEDGQTLSQRLAEDGPLPDGELRRILAGLLDGLEAVHNSAILHRDLKPSNVMLRGDGTPLLIDFGAARDFKARSSRSVTSIATRGYSPPEQYGVGGQQGPWTDIYALGGILYRCVTGQVPIDSLARLRNDPLVPAVQAARDRGYDPVLLRTIDWMLKVNEEDRPTSVAQLRIALADNRSDTVGIAPPPASSSGVVPPTAAATAQNERTSGSLLWLMIPILCLLPVLAFISWPLTTETDQTPPSAPVAAQTEPAPTSVAAVPQPTPEPTPKPVDPPDDPEQKLNDSAFGDSKSATSTDNSIGQDNDKSAPPRSPPSVVPSQSQQAELMTGAPTVEEQATGRDTSAPEAFTRPWDLPPTVDGASASPETYWRHNELIMRLETDGNGRRFFYQSPRPGIQAMGGIAGSLLFDGQRIGMRYEGTSRIFRGRCGVFEYAVSGEVAEDQRSVTLTGRAPLVDKDCKIKNYILDTLVFELIESW